MTERAIHMDALLIGSQAMNYWFADARQPVDYDFFITAAACDAWLKRFQQQVGPANETRPGKFVCRVGHIRLEFETDVSESVRWFMAANEHAPPTSTPLFGLECRLADPRSLLAIKRSHLHLARNWQKHIDDYHFMKRNLSHHRTPPPPARYLGCTDCTPGLKLRLAELREREKSQKTLAVSNEDFFERSAAQVDRVYRHDDLHNIVKYYDTPLFEKAKLNPSKANLSRKLFEEFGLEDKCNLVREEAYVIALERVIIPRQRRRAVLERYGIVGAADQRDAALSAYRHALMRICTTLTKGWFRDFAIDNYPQVSDPNVDYVGLFEAAVAAGTIGEPQLTR